MIREELRQLKTAPRDLRRFGLLVGGVFVVLSLVLWLRHKPAFPWLFAPGLALVLLGTLFPRTLKYAYLGWMALAFALGTVVSTLLLTVFYFLVVTPIGLLSRLAGKDFLRLKLDHQASSYWMPRPRTPRKPHDYERQF